MAATTEGAPKRVNIYKIEITKGIVADLSFNMECGPNRTGLHVVVEPMTGKHIVSWQLDEPKAESFFKALKGLEISPDTECVVGGLADTTHKKVKYAALEAWFSEKGGPAYCEVRTPTDTFHWHLSHTGGSTVAVSSDSRVSTKRLKALFDGTEKEGAKLEVLDEQTLDLHLDEFIEAARAASGK